MLLLRPLSSRCPLHRSPRALLEAARVSSRSKLKVVGEKRAPLKGWREMTTKLREVPEAQRNHLQATVGICTLGDSTTVTNRNVSHPSDVMKEKHWKSMKTICQTEFCSFPRCFFCDGPLTERRLTGPQVQVPALHLTLRWRSPGVRPSANHRSLHLDDDLSHPPPPPVRHTAGD